MATFFTILLLIDAIALIAVVLLQQGKSAGLSGAIAGGAEQLMGKQKGRGIDRLLHNITRILAGLFMVLAVVVGFFLK
ncbi:preprotein translocase subunit SecG [Thermicanus aegyptius]|uniref:preprotein translocase subunit SecG n=1 Tax=Thermicanus aegyptius TaxID=94009 RepID=UPI00041C23E5|nr:preprotein translocase subunit SecG [Thermicanus aegyptius]